MALLKSNSDTDIKEIKNVINKNVASSFRTQPSFVELLKLNGCPALKVGVIGSEIRQQLITEAENGDLTPDTVMPRAYTLIGEYLEIKNVRTYNDLDNYKAISLRQTGFDAMLPYTASGVQYGFVGKNALGGANYISTTLGEGRTEWKPSKVLFEEDGLRIVETEQFIYYKQVDHVNYSQNPDKKGFLDIKRNAVTFVMKNGDQFIMRVTADELESIKQTIDSNVKETDDVGRSDDDDILIKYFDMFEKGLITREEFDLKKAELYNKTEDNTLLKQEHVHPLYCSSCGNKLDENANFCPYCGNKIN